MELTVTIEAAKQRIRIGEYQPLPKLFVGGNFNGLAIDPWIAYT